ncbi:hypothetical protein PS862_01957 [Pseudomonas fluorescens]|uniref:Uncharacterized protein n=1 Tax=Pseudomonas fluorescens TaxID=294 RepID=A0A5E6UXJ2_PSEFL|nr:hypothetical protein PS639_03487 [Pseudomonas fluorescens]VVO83546.1 hypothetical protein PS862_01957 [Pseudomonas fluorescens]
MATPVGARLAREEDNAVFQKDRVNFFAGKPRSYRGTVCLT